MHKFCHTLLACRSRIPFRLGGSHCHENRLHENNEISILSQVSPGSCAQPELLRGDIITKIEDYDARDLRHEDAQMLFRNASNQIKIVVRRDDNIALKQCLSNETSRCPSTVPGAQTPENASYPPEFDNQPHRYKKINRKV
jgi:PDZ domain